MGILDDAQISLPISIRKVDWQLVPPGQASQLGILTMASREDPYVSLEAINGENMPLVAGEPADDRLNLFGCCEVPRSIFNVVALGLIFMLLFTAFAPSQVSDQVACKAKQTICLFFEILTHFLSFFGLFRTYNPPSIMEAGPVHTLLVLFISPLP